MSSKETSGNENKNALESRERPVRPSDSAGDGESTDDSSVSAWGPDDGRSFDGRQRHRVHAGRRHPDWGDRLWRRSRHSRGDAGGRGRDLGPPAAFPDRATTYGDERRRGRRHETRPDAADGRQPVNRQRADSTARDSPRAVEFDPVRRWGPVERERSARFEVYGDDLRKTGRSGRDGGRPDRACGRADHPHGSSGAGTGQGRRSF
jgi:hypothetical protein